MLSFNISYRDLIKFPYLVDTTERGVGRARDGDFMDNIIVILSFMVDLILKISFVNNEVQN
jgi:hypothetical protein